jgi:hypothetical protein
MPFHGLVHRPSDVHLSRKGKSPINRSFQMSMFNRFTALFDAVSAANHYHSLLALSDRDLAARGLSRDGLTRSYIWGISAN